MSLQKLYASLIGINAYENASHLNGCIRDILNFDRILRRICDKPSNKLEYQPLYFLSPHQADQKVIEEYSESEGVELEYLKPDFAHVSGKAFDHLARARDKDICIFYYSGHGSYSPAPEVFSQSQPGKKNQTLVCCDSRSGARDLIDKELAYLLYKTLRDKPDVHCLVIMDCCHSGSNTRGLQKKSEAVSFRHQPASNKLPAFEDYLGYKENFYTREENGQVSFPIARYVQMGACRENEKAMDSYAGGLFSENLARYLNNGSGRDSYRNIAQNLASTISLKNGLQNPVVFPANNLIDQPFLGGKEIVYEPSYEVRYVRDHWQLQAGALQGIVPSANSVKTIIRIVPENVKAKVTSVSDFTSVLEGEGLSVLDKKNSRYKGSLVKLAIKKQAVGFSDELDSRTELRRELKDAWERADCLYFELIGKGASSPDYIIRCLETEQARYFYLTQPGSDMPVFKSETDPVSFMDNVDSVCKWMHVKALRVENSIFSKDDFIFKVEIVEGREITPTNRAGMKGVERRVVPGEQIDLAYVDNLLPAMRFSVTIAPESSLQECYIRTMYLDSLYGIRTDMSEPDSSRLDKNGKFNLKIRLDGRYHDLIRFGIDEKYARYNVNEILEQLKIVVSARPNISLDTYIQMPLKLDDTIYSKIKAPEGADDAIPAARWAVFNFPVRTIGPRKEKLLGGNKAADFQSFTLQAPAGFNAVATAVTSVDIQASSRSVERIFPDIWGDTLTEDFAFPDEFGATVGSGVVAIELSAPEGGSLPELKKGESLILKPKFSGQTRSVDEYESATVPFGFDEETGLYFPVGYEDWGGNIHITCLPRPDFSTLASDAVTTRSIFGSIKLYFKKLLRKQSTQLVLHQYTEGNWEKTTNENEIREKLKKLGKATLPLIIHGIFGDTKGILEGLKLDTGFSGNAPSVLSYDYENLQTTVPQTATLLEQQLRNVGIGNEGTPRLVILAHSMGGLVSRWLIEKKSGRKYVSKLVMAGTPNGGSEWSQASDYIFKGAGFLLTHALNVSGPLKYAISALGFFIKKLHDPQQTLKDMSASSEMIKELAQSSPPEGIPYSLIGSDTNLYRHYDGNDTFLKKAKEFFMEKIVFPGLDTALFKDRPNDMAVTVESMENVPGFGTGDKVVILPGDHISYFSDERTRKEILGKLFN